MITLLSPTFRDLIIDDLIQLGKEHSCRITREDGGYARVFKRFKDIKRSLFEVISTGEKLSIIALRGERKTTITEITVLPDINSWLSKCSHEVILIQYAEDFSWDQPIEPANLEGKRLIIDFSGRFLALRDITKVVRSVEKAAKEIVLIFTDHDNLAAGEFCEIIGPNVSIFWHSPNTMEHHTVMGTLSIPNQWFLTTPIDFVGLGDYVAFRLALQYASQQHIDALFIQRIQQNIHGLMLNER